MSNEEIRGQRQEDDLPRYAGFATFALLPRIDQVPHADIAVVGVPFDSGTSFRPGARFGPSHIREHSRQLHPYHAVHDTFPFQNQQVVDAGDFGVGPYGIDAAVETIHAKASRLTTHGTRILALGGDHTIALPLLRAAAEVHGPLAVLHFDAHLDTWDVLPRGGCPTLRTDPSYQRLVRVPAMARPRRAQRVLRSGSLGHRSWQCCRTPPEHVTKEDDR